jgi:hypothetical protein
MIGSDEQRLAKAGMTLMFIAIWATVVSVVLGWIGANAAAKLLYDGSGPVFWAGLIILAASESPRHR